MPIIKSAKKKLRQDKKRTEQNLLVKNEIKKTFKELKKKATPELLVKFFSIVDTAVKKNIFHKNKAARLKSRLSKLLSPKLEKTTTATPKKKSSKKT